MILDIILDLGPWSWWVIGLILLGLEIVIPGILLLWIGVAAMVIGAISFLLWDSYIWSWQIQVTIFAILSVLSSYLGKRWIADRQGKSDQPLLNKRTQSLIGRQATLEEPIENGRGRIKLDDTLWVVEGPDLDKGETIKIISAHSNRLVVTSA